MLQDALITAIAVQFGVLLAAAVIRHRRSRQPGALELAQVLAVYCFAASTSALLALPSTSLSAIGEVALSATLAVVPYLMLRFAAAFDPLPERSERALRRATPVLALVAGSAGVEGLLPDVSLFVVIGVVVAVWVAAHAVAAVRMWQGARHVGAAVVRRRSQLMAAGLGGLAAVMPVGGVTGALTGGDVTVTLLWSLLATSVFLVGFAPPVWLRWQWSRRDRHSLTVAELELLRSDDPAHLVSQLLPHVGRLLGADVAWLTVDGGVVAATGPLPSGVDPADEERAGAPVPGAAFTRRSPSGASSIVEVWTGSGWFGAVVGPYALLSGAGELDDVRVLVVHLEVALDRARLRARELEAVRRLEHAQRVRQVDEIREDVLATVSHEMRTPLTTVCGATELLLMRWDDLDDDRRRDFVARVQSNATHLRQVVQSLLDLTDLRGASPPQVHWFAVGEIVDEVTHALRVALDRYEVEVAVDAGIDVATDRQGLARVLEHLLINAAKFSVPGSRITIAATTSPDDVVTIGVEDEGPGVDRDDLASLLEPFTRGGHVLTRDTRGLGVGLAVVAGVLQRIGGSLDVQSGAGGRGSRFLVTLPRTSGSQDAALDRAVVLQR